MAYWRQATYEATVSYGLPSGLLCRGLETRGVGAYDALRYYIGEGFPSRMDADGNGIPCENHLRGRSGGTAVRVPSRRSRSPVADWTSPT